MKIVCRSFAILMALAFIAMSCGSEEAALSEIRSNSKIQFDPSLGDQERSMLNQDVTKLLGYQLQVNPKSYFGTAFGGTTTREVLSYVEERVKHIIPQKLNIEDHLRLKNKSVSSFTAPTEPSQDPERKLTLMAANLGFLLWLTYELNYPQELVFFSGNDLIPIDTSRNGIIELGEGYTDPRSNPELRIATLVHEARHSDCTGGMSGADLQKFSEVGRPGSPTCGYAHVECEADSYLAGEVACDGVAWGAYSIESIYNLAVTNSCKNCNEEQKQVSKMVALDSLSRLRKQTVEDMVDRKLPAPDMSSGGIIR